jgi:hypothetical protein
METDRSGAHNRGVFAVWLKGTDVTLFWKEHQKPTRFCMPEAEPEGPASGMALQLEAG